MRQGPGGFQPFNKHLKGDILVFIGGQAAPSHLDQQLGDGGIAGQVDPQHQGVDEKAHQLVERRVAASGDRESHRHIGSGAKPGQQRRQRRLDHHETGHVVFAGQITYPLLQRRRPFHLYLFAAVIGDQRIGPVGGQLQALGQPGQGILPEAQLRGDRAVAVVRVPQLLTLPQRVIDVL
ncbi:hypothetical protein LAUMK7_05716 [Mycobacterium kansasii]|nr:hypothetical protein LAUMK22_05695 [Mycobacterium kansasii]VAZ69777.1 hypothetical protein LAUMK40_05940 [Mycobacterium kansasii]VAZ81148.1 hypothetical protein LAUMK7_05716 [Mycobacterium kansasii]